MNSKPFTKDESKLINKKLTFQRCFYSIIGTVIIFVIILLTFGQIRDMKKDNREFAFYLLILIHSGLVLLNFIFI
jgi:hypothetical protein